MLDNVIIDIQGLTKIYPRRFESAIDNLSLQIKSGEFYGLLGPNGAGKTTTISVLTGLLKPTSGSVLIKNHNVATQLDAIKPAIGVVSQDIALYEKLTAHENLYYFGRLYGIEKKKLNQRIDFLLDRLGLLKYKDHKVNSFSGGMKRRINIMAGILHEPEIVILDEPVVGVDVHSRNVIREFLKEVNKQGKTIIYTSHIMEDAEKLCSKVAIIDYGKLVEVGAPHELVLKYPDCQSLEEVFLKLTGQNLRD